MIEKEQEALDLTLTILEKERTRIARELHDVTIQNMIHSIHQTELILHYMEKDPVQAKLELSALSKNLKDAINDTRNIIYDLKPMAISDLGFKEALEEYFIYLQTISKIQFSYDIDDDLSKLTDQTLLVIFRIIQEACRNTVKHSEATQLKITIQKYQKKYFKIAIDDNGIGCLEEAFHKINHYGLQILDERVRMISGTYTIDTDINKGFHITVIVPMTNQEAADR